MAWGRKKSGGRKEPQFGLGASLAELRLGPQDRVAAAERREAEETIPQTPEPSMSDDDEAPRERKPRASRASRKRKSGGRARGGLFRLFYWGAVLGLWGAIAVVGVMVWVGAHLPAIQSLEIPKRPPTIQITGLDGSVLATRGEMAGANVALKDLPPYLPKAFIAIEDRRFYSHYGVDPLGIARAAVTNILHRGVSQGGSTLTQQLAKNLFLTQERTFQRKLQEVELALWLERKHSKAEILELYLNRVYFGSGAYGVEAAAQRYFGKSAKNVTLAEAAMLAGLVKSPSRLAPNRNPEGAEQRAQTVLDRDGGRQIHHRSAGAGLDRAPLLQREAGRRRHGQLCGGLDRRSARRSHRPDRPERRGRNLDRSETAGGRRSRRDRRTCGEEREIQCQPGRAGGDDAGWRGARHGRRPQLCRKPVQPRGDRQAPAGLGVQALRLSHRDRSRPDAGDDPAGCAARRQGLEARELQPSNISAR